MTTATLEETQAAQANESEIEVLYGYLVQTLSELERDAELLTIEKLESLTPDQRDALIAWNKDVMAALADDDDAPLMPATLESLLAPERPKPETREQAVERLEAEIEARKASLDRAKVRAMEAAEESKAAKKAAEAAQERLDITVQDWIDARHGDWQPQLPFPAEAPEQPAAAKPGDPGKVTAISELHITPSQIEKLEDADIATIAELEAAMASDTLRKVKGIGLAAIDKISDAVMAWRQLNGYGE